MNVKIADFNGSDILLKGKKRREWREIMATLQRMPLHLKASDQSQKQGALIFDPVGTNAYIKKALEPYGWQTAKISEEYAFLGIGVDFAKSGTIIEAQFSNYPFLLNNLLRSELFFREHVPFAGAPMAVAVVVVKAAMFPASNSTLYYEQALNQLNGLAKFKLFSVPIRLVGLFSPIAERVPATFTTYSAARYARVVVKQASITCTITIGRSGRCRIAREV